MASKTSAVADEPIEVLFALHNKFNLLDFAGPVEVLTSALHDPKDPSESDPEHRSDFGQSLHHTTMIGVHERGD